MKQTTATALTLGSIGFLVVLLILVVLGSSIVAPPADAIWAVVIGSAIAVAVVTGIIGIRSLK